MRFLKALAALSCVSVFLCGMMLSAGCSSGETADERAVREALSVELELVKNLDEGFIEGLAGDGSGEFEQFGIDAEAFMAEYLEGFDYKITEVVVDGEAASATIQIECRSFSDYQAKVGELVDAAIADGSMPDAGDPEIDAFLGGLMMEALAEVDVAACAPVSVDCAKVEGEWELAEGAGHLLADALSSN